MPRLAIKIRPVHADETECTHAHSTSGKSLDENCPGRAGYAADCNGCPWDTDSPLRVIVEESVRSHRANHQAGRVPVAGDGGAQ